MSGWTSVDFNGAERNCERAPNPGADMDGTDAQLRRRGRRRAGCGAAACCQLSTNGFSPGASFAGDGAQLAPIFGGRCPSIDPPPGAGIGLALTKKQPARHYGFGMQRLTARISSDASPVSPSLAWFISPIGAPFVSTHTSRVAFKTPNLIPSLEDNGDATDLIETAPFPKLSAAIT